MHLRTQTEKHGPSLSSMLLSLHHVPRDRILRHLHLYVIARQCRGGTVSKCPSRNGGQLSFEENLPWKLSPVWDTEIEGTLGLCYSKSGVGGFPQRMIAHREGRERVAQVRWEETIRDASSLFPRLSKPRGLICFQMLSVEGLCGSPTYLLLENHSKCIMDMKEQRDTHVLKQLWWELLFPRYWSTWSSKMSL